MNVTEMRFDECDFPWNGDTIIGMNMNFGKEVFGESEFQLNQCSTIFAINYVCSLIIP